jgi:hypothetical protein
MIFYFLQMRLVNFSLWLSAASPEEQIFRAASRSECGQHGWYHQQVRNSNYCSLTFSVIHYTHCPLSPQHFYQINYCLALPSALLIYFNRLPFFECSDPAVGTVKHELTVSGKVQARAAATSLIEAVGRENVENLIFASSDFTRARETAEECQKALEVPKTAREKNMRRSCPQHMSFYYESFRLLL